MEKDINLVIEQYRQNLLQVINTEQLPPSIKYYILKDVFALAESSYYNYINQIQQQIQAEAAQKSAASAENEEESLKEED